jgi:hypothetical protein
MKVCKHCGKEILCSEISKIWFHNETCITDCMTTTAEPKEEE